MKLIVCLDEREGMLFRSRRQSQDSALRSRILEMSRGAALWMNGYSARQFKEADGICVAEDFLEQAGTEDFCFAETRLPPVEQVTELIVYRWNRHYPSDVKFPLLDYTGGKAAVTVSEFPGSSHERITEEVYRP